MIVGTCHVMSLQLATEERMMVMRRRFAGFHLPGLLSGSGNPGAEIRFGCEPFGDSPKSARPERKSRDSAASYSAWLA